MLMVSGKDAGNSLNSIFDLEWVENASTLNSLNGRARPVVHARLSGDLLPALLISITLESRSGPQTEMAKEWGQGNEIQLLILKPFLCAHSLAK
jgi:hypothetical protein